MENAEKLIALRGDSAPIYLYKFLKENPGLTSREILKKNHIKKIHEYNFSNVLDYILEIKLIKKVNNKYYVTKKPFLIENMNPHYSILKKPSFRKNSNPSKILNFIQENPSATKKQIIHKFETFRKTLKNCLRKGYIKKANPYINLDELPNKNLFEIFDKKTKPFHLKHNSIECLIYFLIKENPGITRREVIKVLKKNNSNFNKNSYNNSFSVILKKQLLKTKFDQNKDHIYFVDSDKQIKIENMNPLYRVIPNNKPEENSFLKKFYDFIQEKTIIDKKTVLNRIKEENIPRPHNYIYQLENNNYIEAINPYYDIEEIKLEGTKLIFPEPDLEGGNMKKEIWEAEIIAKSKKDLPKIKSMCSKSAYNLARNVLEFCPIVNDGTRLWVPLNRFFDKFLSDFLNIKQSRGLFQSKMEEFANTKGYYTIITSEYLPEVFSPMAITFFDLEMASDLYKLWDLFIGEIQTFFLLFDPKHSLKDVYTKQGVAGKTLYNICKTIYEENSVELKFDHIEKFFNWFKEKDLLPPIIAGSNILESDKTKTEKVSELMTLYHLFLKKQSEATITNLEAPDPKANIQPKTNEIIIKKQITPKMENLFSYLKQLGFENSILETNENIYADAGGIVMFLFDTAFKSKTMQNFPALTAFMPNGQQKDVIPLESLPVFLEEFADLFFDIIEQIKNASEQDPYVESDVSSA